MKYRGAIWTAVLEWTCGELNHRFDNLSADLSPLARLEAMLATCDDSLEGLRDRALLCFGFASGGRRRSEIAAADLRDLRRIGAAAVELGEVGQADAADRNPRQGGLECHDGIGWRRPFGPWPMVCISASSAASWLSSRASRPSIANPVLRQARAQKCAYFRPACQPFYACLTRGQTPWEGIGYGNDRQRR